MSAVARGNTSGTFNLGNGSARPLAEYIEAIRAEVGCDAQPEYGAVPYRPDQVMHLEADISRLTEASGWSPRTSLADGIKAVVAAERTREIATSD